MPFDNVEALKDPAKYKTILKAELAKLKGVPARFQYFENFPFTGKAGPLVVVGPHKDDFIKEVKAAGADFKAKGRCMQRQDALMFSAEQGTLKEDKLNLALKVAGEEAQVVDDLGVEVVDGPGGQGSASDAVADATKAQAKLQALVAAFDKLKSKFTDDERKDFRADLHAAAQLVQSGQGPAALVKLDQVRTDLDRVAQRAHPERAALPGGVAPLARQANQAEKDILAQEAEAATKWKEAQDKANLAITTAETTLADAKRQVEDLAAKKGNMKTREYNLQKPAADAALKKASDALALRKLELNLLAKEPEVPPAVLKPLLDRYKQLTDQLAQLNQRMDKLAIETDGSLPDGPPGKLADNPGLARASNAVDAALNQQGELRGKITAALKKQKAAIASLDARWQKLAGQIAGETGAKVDPQALAELVQLREAREKLETVPVANLDFDAGFDQDAQACARRMVEAEKALAALQQALQRAGEAAQRHAQFAQRASQAGVQLAGTARSAVDAAEQQAAALKQALAKAPFTLDTTALDNALAQAGQRLDAAEPALEALGKAIAQAAAPLQRFDQLAQRVATVSGQALDAQARGERTQLEQRLQAARQAFAQSLAFDAQPIAEAIASLETRSSAGESALKALESALAAATPALAAFDQLEQRIDAVLDAGALEAGVAQLRTTCQTAMDDARRALARTLSFDAQALNQAQAALSGWTAARAIVIGEVENRQLRAAYQQARSAAPANAVLPRSKASLDKLLCGLAAPSAGALKKLYIVLAPANDSERNEAFTERNLLEAESKSWGKKFFTNDLLAKVWASASKVGTSGGIGVTIGKCSLEDVEAAILLWQQANASAVGVVSNLHVPGGGRPQYKNDKNATRNGVEANFMSVWAGQVVNVHADITVTNQGPMYIDNRINWPLVQSLKAAGRLSQR